MQWFKRILFLLFCAFCIDAFSAEKMVSVSGIETNEPLIVMQNKWLNLNIVPKSGGRIVGLTYKPTLMELTNSSGLLNDGVWLPDIRFYFMNKSFNFDVNQKNNSAETTLQCTGTDDILRFLDMKKIIGIDSESCSFSVSYCFENIPSSMSSLEFGFWFHNILGVNGDSATYYYPTINGIKAVGPEAQNKEILIKKLSRGWMGVVGKSGTGIVAVIDYPYLQEAYNWFSGLTIPTFEWRFGKINIPHGKSFNTCVVYIPFHGLPKISGAGRSLVGSIETNKSHYAPGEEIEVSAKIFSATQQKVKVVLQERVMPNSAWKQLQEKELIFDVPGIIQNFTYKYIPEKKGTIAFCLLLLGEDGNELARLDCDAILGNFSSEYILDPLEGKMFSPEKSYDLTKLYTENTLKSTFPKWAAPYAGGTLRILALVDFSNYQDVSELTNRMDVELTSTRIYQVNPKWKVGDNYGKTTLDDMHEAIAGILKKDYDVILIGGLPWEFFREAERSEIAKKVAAGTGLVRVWTDGKAPMDLLKDIDKTVMAAVPRATKSGFLTDGIPFSAFPATEISCYGRCSGTVEAVIPGGNIPYLVSGKYQKGRVVNFAYTAQQPFGKQQNGAGILPAIRQAEENGITWDYWEYYYSMLAKAIIWAGRKESGSTLSGIQFKEVAGTGKLSYEFNSNGNSDSFHAETVIRDKFYRVLTSFKENIMPSQNRTIVKDFNLPQFSGINFAEIIIRDRQNKVVAWGTTCLTRKTADITELKAEPEFCKWGKPAHITASATKDFNGKLNLQLVDSYGRVISQKEFTGAGPHLWDANINSTLISRLYKVIATLTMDEQECARRELAIKVIPGEKQLQWTDFEVCIYLTTPAIIGVREHFWPLIAAKLDQMGISTIVSNSSYIDTTFSPRFNYHPTFLEGAGLIRNAAPSKYIKTGNKRQLIRKQCLSDPAFLQETATRFCAKSQCSSSYMPRWIWIGDELSLTGYSGQPIDFCFSEFCLEHFRLWAKEKYGSLEKLNSEWECDFKSWDTVIPMTREEVWKRKNPNYSPWADHLEYMDYLLYSFLQDTVKSNLRKYAPTVRLSICGTQPARAYGGMDWSRLASVFDNLMSYYAIDQGEMHRSFGPNSSNTPCVLGYAHTGAQCNYNIWQSLIYDSKGCLFFHLPTFTDPDYTFTNSAKDAMHYLKPVLEGIGKFKINCLNTRPAVGIHYSQASLRGAFILKREEAHEALRHKYFRLCEYQGIPFEMVSGKEMERNPRILIEKGYKMFIMPDSMAVSDAEIEAVRQFVRNGGTVITEGDAGTMNENCRILKYDMIEKMIKDSFAKHLECPFVPVWRTPMKQQCPLITAGKLENGQIFFMNSMDIDYSKAYMLTNTPESESLLKRENDFFNSLLGAAGLSRTILVKDAANGKVLPFVQIFPYTDNKGNDYFILLSNDDNQHNVDLVFPGKAWRYDILSKKTFGFTDTIRVVFSKSSSIFCAGLKKPLNSNLSIKLDEKIQRGHALNYKLNFDSSVDTVVHLRFIGPDGKERGFYSGNRILRNGVFEEEFVFAWNDTPGNWKLSATEIITGSRTEKDFWIE